MTISLNSLSNNCLFLFHLVLFMRLCLAFVITFPVTMESPLLTLGPPGGDPGTTPVAHIHRFEP